MCDWDETINPHESWLIGEIDGNSYEEHAIPLWKYENGRCVRRTPEEVQADIDKIPDPEPTPAEILRADVDFLLMLVDEEATL